MKSLAASFLLTLQLALLLHTGKPLNFVMHRRETGGIGLSYRAVGLKFVLCMHHPFLYGHAWCVNVFFYYLLLSHFCIGCCQIQKPVRLGQLIPDPLRGSDSVSGLVFLLNRDTVYFRDFEYNVDLSEWLIENYCYQFFWWTSNLEQ